MKKRLFLIFACGEGGSSYGFILEGWECSGAIDYDGDILEWHRRNMPEAPVHQLDLNTVKVETIILLCGLVDAVVITCPCQGISAAGLFDPFDSRNATLLRCIRMLRYLKPKAVLIENVSGIKKGRMNTFYWIVMEELLQLSDLYVFDDRILNALHYLTPQRRERWFCMMFRRDLGITPSWPTPNFEAAESFRIRNILPHYEYLTYGFHNKDKTRLEKILMPGDFLPTLTATPNLRIPDGRNLPIHEKAMAFGLPETWLHPENEALANTMIGNMVAVPMAQALAKHIHLLLDRAGA